VLVAAHHRAAWTTLIVMVIAGLLQFNAHAQQPEGARGPQGPQQAVGPQVPQRTDAVTGIGMPPLRVELGGANTDGDSATLIQLMLLLTLLTLAPSIVIMMTPFTRIVVVLGLLRNALGTQQSPPNSVLVGLALFLSLFVMSPVLTNINDNAVRPYLNEEIGYSEALARGQAPLRTFMLNQTRDKDLALFVDLAKLDVDEVTVDSIPMNVVIPAFMISELKTAFQLGFVIYLPFLVVDMVVASILMSMGMLMLPPVLISLPFKLLMFVLSDGWNLIFGSLVRSFRM
jgi:flagellar biosynthetic protein FliP